MVTFFGSAEARRYGREFLLRCSQFPESRKVPESLVQFFAEFPNLQRKATEMGVDVADDSVSPKSSSCNNNRDRFYKTPFRPKTFHLFFSLNLG
jgi:hypothetical protein